MITILLLASSPANSPILRLDAEAREIDNALREADLRDRFSIEKHLAVRVQDLQPLLLRYEPDIVHFCGHGNQANEILVEDDHGLVHPIPTEALSELFALLGENTRCVVLNICNSESQARAIAQHIGYVVGMSSQIDDHAAILFSRAFYRALGYGKSVEVAFNLGRLEIAAQGLQAREIPILVKNDKVNGDHNAVMVVPRLDPVEVPELRSAMSAKFSGDRNRLLVFCQEFFPDFVYPTNLPVDWAIALLISHCREQDKLELLQSLTVGVRPWTKWFGTIRNAVRMGRKEQHSAKHSKRTQIELTIEFPFESISPDIIAAGIDAMADKCNVPRSQVTLRELRQGSTVIKLDVPSDLLDRLVEMYETDRERLSQDLGISFIAEVPDNPYYIKNLYQLFAKEFEYQELQQFCTANAVALSIGQTLAGNTEEVAEQLIAHAMTTDTIPLLLNLAQNFKPNAYDEHRPYYVEVRRWGRLRKTTSLRATRREISVAALRGFGIAFAGSFVLFLLTYWFEEVNSSEGLYLIFTLFAGLISFLLGDIVGAQVSASCKHKDDPRLGKVAAVTFLLGFLSGGSYSLILLYGLAQDVIDDKILWFIISTFLVPLVVIFAIVITMVAIVIDPASISTISNLLNLGFGGFAAYRSAKR
jgi:hypothetical protein